MARDPEISSPISPASTSTEQRSMPELDDDLFGNVTRRSFLAQAGAVGLAASAHPLMAAAKPLAETLAENADAVMPAGVTVPVTLTVNGEAHDLHLDPRTTLLDCLRENLALSGTKKGCDHGQCGACTVHVDGRRVNSCLSFAIMHVGQKITTVEGLGTPEKLHPMQAAFVEHDAYQCGYCTSGQIMSAVALAHENCGPTDADVRQSMYGNICRCGSYPNIVAAVQQGRKQA